MRYSERWSRCSASSVEVLASTYGYVRPFSNGGAKLECRSQRQRADEPLLVSVRMTLVSGVQSLLLRSLVNTLGREERDFRTVRPTFSMGLLRPDRLQKARQLRRRLVLRNWLQFLERAGEGVRQAPHGSRLELLMHGLKVQLVHPPRQVLRKPQIRPR